MTTGAAETPAVLHIANVRQVLAVLQAVRLRTGYKQQFCTLLLGTDGLSLRWEEESKALQSSVYLRPNVFARFECQDPRRVIGLNLGTLMDTLSVFASSTGHLEVEPTHAWLSNLLVFRATKLSTSEVLIYLPWMCR